MTDTELEIHNEWLLYHSMVTGMGLKPTEQGFCRFHRWFLNFRGLHRNKKTLKSEDIIEDVIIEQARKCEEIL